MRSLLSKIGNRVLGHLQERRYSRPQMVFNTDLAFTQSATKFLDRNQLYAYLHHHFHYLCPEELRAHRAFFKKNQRGFGEDAFHAMWWLLLREFKPVSCLEIGVYRGQVISLWALIARHLGFACQVHGISPFTPIGDQVSIYREDVDYLKDTQEFFKSFDLPSPTLLRSLSTERTAREHISAGNWDLIYIDGGHDYEVVLADYKLCCAHLNSGGILVMDDSSLNTEYRPPLFSFAGHPGPTRVCQEHAMNELRFLGAAGHNNVFIKE